MIEFIGRLHPAFVHFPIGIFILLIIVEFASFHPKRKTWTAVIVPMYIIGLICSALSLLTGFLLSQEGDHNSSAVDLHKWIAIITSLLFLFYVFFRNFIIKNKNGHLASLICLLLSIVITGHLGGSLTHGADYLTIKKEEISLDKTVNIKDINQAILYKDIVQHTLNMKCIQCHGVDKQKGKLRLDGINWIQQGGKNGMVINAQQPDQSELIKRILLEINDEHHMPPKGKPQLTAFEQHILQWWIQTGASFEEKVTSMQPDEKMMKALIAFKDHYSSSTKTIKRKEVAAITHSQKKELEQLGWVISAISNEDNHIRAVGFNLEKPVKQAIDKLLSIKEQLVEVKLSSSGIKDDDIDAINKLNNLEKLWLDGNDLTDNIVSKIIGLNELTYLNLSSTKITEKGIEPLKKLTKLRSIYLYKVDQKKADSVSSNTYNLTR
jgi:uncharacterized membrane protein